MATEPAPFTAALLAVLLAALPAAADGRDDCRFIKAADFNPVKYSTPDCVLERGLSIAQLNACSTEVSALGKLVDESWSRAYAAAKAATEKCMAPYLKQDAIARADEAAKAALNGSLASDLSAYLRGAGTPTNRAAFERVQSVAKLIGDIQNDALGGLTADVTSFASNPVAPLPPVRSDGSWSMVAHPPTAAALAADRRTWDRSRQEAIDARAAAAQQQAAEQAAARQREEAVAAASAASSSEDDDDSSGATTAAMMGMMGTMGGVTPSYVPRPTPSAPSYASTPSHASTASQGYRGPTQQCNYVDRYGQRPCQ